MSTAKSESLFELGTVIDPRRNEYLHQEEIESSILKNNCLESSTINSYLAVIRSERPEIGALVNVQHADVDLEPTLSERWIQVFNTGNHWIVLAKGFGKDPSRIMCFDSLTTSSGPDKKAITGASLIEHCIADTIEIHLMPCQKQTDGYNCGPFALAFATALALGHNPCEIRFDVSKMRDHIKKTLIDFDQGRNPHFKLSKFPEIHRISNRNWKPVGSIKENIFCKCRAPHDTNQEVHPSKFTKMIKCYICKNQFHIGCVNPEKGKLFRCENCLHPLPDDQDNEAAANNLQYDSNYTSFSYHIMYSSIMVTVIILNLYL